MLDYFIDGPGQFYFLSWILLSFLAAYFADKRGLNGGQVFIGSLLFSPLLGLLLTFVLKPSEKQLLRTARGKTCPECAEVVRFEARLCKHCGNGFYDGR